MNLGNLVAPAGADSRRVRSRDFGPTHLTGGSNGRNT